MRGKHFIFIFLITLLTSAFVWVRLQIVSISYEIHELQKTERALREDNNAISLKLHELRSPQRMELLAKQLKMEPPRSDQNIILKEK